MQAKRKVHFVIIDCHETNSVPTNNSQLEFAQSTNFLGDEVPLESIRGDVLYPRYNEPSQLVQVRLGTAMFAYFFYFFLR